MFWCIESIFNQIKGVEVVISGYMGGTKIQQTIMMFVLVKPDTPKL